MLTGRLFRINCRRALYTLKGDGVRRAIDETYGKPEKALKGYTEKLEKDRAFCFDPSDLIAVTTGTLSTHRGRTACDGRCEINNEWRLVVHTNNHRATSI